MRLSLVASTAVPLPVAPYLMDGDLADDFWTIRTVEVPAARTA